MFLKISRCSPMLHCTCRAGRPALGSMATLGEETVPGTGNCPGLRLGQGTGVNGRPLRKIMAGWPKAGELNGAGTGMPEEAPLLSGVPLYTIPHPARTTVLALIW